MDEIDQTKEDSVSDSTDELCDAITIARERLREHGEYIGEKEVRTRVLIIDQILRELGWDVTDPKLIHMEVGSNGSTIDYVLIGESGEYFAVVEAKRSKEGLSSAHRRQASGYAVELGVSFAILTNGSRWEAWEVNSGTARKKAMIVETNITTGDTIEIANDMMGIHRLRLLAGESSRRY